MHGGDIYRHPIRLDFSVNINPLGLPEGTERVFDDLLTKCRAYPDLISEGLRAAIGNMEEISPEFILCGNGASELFAAIVHAVRPQKALVLTPGFSGYEKALKMETGCRILKVALKKESGFLPDEETVEALDPDADILFLASPNNPTGQLIPEKILKALLDKCLKEKIIVVFDECFEPFVRDYQGQTQSLDLTAAYDNLISVRAFTKIFAMPGIRLGYLVCRNEGLREAISRQLPEWNVSVPAQLIGREAAKEARPFMEKTAAYVAKERAYLAEELKNLGFEVFPGQANFILFRTDLPLYDLLLERGVLIRDCSDYDGLASGYFRTAVRTHEENETFVGILREVVTHA